jgi:hypothetical protein
MSPQNTLRDWARLIYYLGQNIISLIGVVLTTSSALTLIGFWAFDFMLPGPPHPYIGILLFLILPAFFLLGLILIPIGIFLRRRRLRSAGELPAIYPEIDLKTSQVRNGLLFVGLATILNVMIFGVASYRGVAYMDTASFCGQTCHTVMAPEFTAHQGSTHSNVECVGCHVGPGAGGYVRAKVSGLHQLYALAFKTYPTPVPSPVNNLPSTSNTCEHCHWPQRIAGDKLLVKTNYKDDEGIPSRLRLWS